MEERLYKKLESYGRSDFYPFHMPGHKRNPLAVDGEILRRLTDSIICIMRRIS